MYRHRPARRRPGVESEKWGGAQTTTAYLGGAYFTINFIVSKIISYIC